MAFYPALFEHTAEDEVVVSFRDLPECLTSGFDEAEARAEAQDALEEAIVGRIIDGEEIPLPSLLRAGERYVFVPVIHAGTFASVWRKLNHDIGIVLGSSSNESHSAFTYVTDNAARAQAVSRYTAEALNVLCVTRSEEWNQPASMPGFSWAVELDAGLLAMWSNPNAVEKHEPNYLAEIASLNSWFERNPSEALTACDCRHPVIFGSDFQQDVWYNLEYMQAWDRMGLIKGNKGDYTRAISDVSHVIESYPDYAAEWRSCGMTYAIQETYEKFLLYPTSAIDPVEHTNVDHWDVRPNIMGFTVGAHAQSTALGIKSLVLKQS